MPRRNTGIVSQLLEQLRAPLTALLVLFGLFQLVSCSPGDPVEPEGNSSTAPDSPADSVDAPADTEDSDATSPAEESSPGTGSPDEPTPAATATPDPVIAVGDDDIVEIVELEAGDQQVDAQGNLIVMYGAARWPDGVTALSESVRSEFAFADDFDVLRDPQLDLVAIDVGMCAAGIGSGGAASAGFGTVEFFVHDSPTAPLSSEPLIDRAMVTAHPVLGSGFEFPAEATCSRGWIPVLRSTGAPIATARYVLTNRASSSAPIERHVYQWQVDLDSPVAHAGNAAADLGGGGVGLDDDAEADVFGMGQTVTFNTGALADTTVVVEGWSELVGVPAALDGTRMVAVSLSFCPSSLALPEFGLAIDGWNLVAPEPDSDLLGAQTAADPTQSCFDGWLRFAVPYGAVPTGFFTSDGSSVESGYAFWSLDGAALPAPDG